MQAIRDAQKAVEKRACQLDIEKRSSRQKELEERFNSHRQRDQQMIQALSHDYNKLKNAIQSGEFKEESLAVRANGPAKIRTMDANRFVGFETQEETFQKFVCEKFEKLDQKRSTPVFNATAEQKKVIVITQRYR